MTLVIEPLAFYLLMQCLTNSPTSMTCLNCNKMPYILRSPFLHPVEPADIPGIFDFSSDVPIFAPCGPYLHTRNV